jgi:hypothetical protein
VEKLTNSAWWLLGLAPAAVAAAASLGQRLFSIPDVPRDIAKQLVSAGVRITYAQLLAAANAMVAGVEVWVQAQQQLSIHTDIPAAATAICMGCKTHSLVSTV